MDAMNKVLQGIFDKIPLEEKYKLMQQANNKMRKQMEVRQELTLQGAAINTIGFIIISPVLYILTMLFLSFVEHVGMFAGAIWLVMANFLKYLFW